MHLRTARNVLLLAAMAFASACDTGTGVRPPGAGEISGTWAGTQFRGDAEAFVEQGTLYVFGSSPSGNALSRELWLRVPGFAGPGQYELRAGDGGVRYIIGGDAISSSYSIPASGTGTLVVTSTADGEVAGTVEFYAEADQEGAPVGPRARFQAAFRAPVTAP